MVDNGNISIERLTDSVVRRINTVFLGKPPGTAFCSSIHKKSILNFEKHTTWLACLWAFFSGLFAQWTFNDYGAIVNPLCTEATKLAARQDAADLTAAVKSKTAQANAGMHADMLGDIAAEAKRYAAIQSRGFLMHIARAHQRVFSSEPGSTVYFWRIFRATGST
ncbi:DUF2514 family protein [Citrobacter braakii]|uniref:DUF2514 family protein n=1 Tax=Citrobacter braakii TaxID=57706 RepID=UPI00226FC033|nr:DUF2514 family protein [Citrobacter braakii]WAD32392.1 DUF2514 family protein [Citrobacter braakii]